MNNWIMIKY